MVTKITDITVNPVNSSGSLVANKTVNKVGLWMTFRSDTSHLNEMKV